MTTIFIGTGTEFRKQVMTKKKVKPSLKVFDFDTSNLIVYVGVMRVCYYLDGVNLKL